MSETREKKQSSMQSVYDDTVFFIDSIMQEYSVFSSILSMMKEGKATVELKKRYMLRAIDETWVNAIEDALPALDMIIRNPSKYIEEIEEVLPIELSRNITPRSLQHLSQHSNYISRIEGDTIIPSKILNVYREETMQTYENRFINTLINRLYLFVSRRYEIAKKDGQDEKTTSLDFEQEFTHENKTGKMSFRVELAEPPESDADLRNYTHTTDLWRRVERLNSICASYQESDFAQKMGKSYIHPPVMRTNAIMKNKHLKQCLDLWIFIEGYENAGYSMLVQEDLEKVDEGYLKELYSTLALQYLIFRHNIHNEFDADSMLDSRLSTDELKPRIIDSLADLSLDEFNVIEERRPPIPSQPRYGTLTPEDKLMLQALDIALDAAQIQKEHPPARDLEPAHIPEPEPIAAVDVNAYAEDVPAANVPEEDATEPAVEMVEDATPAAAEPVAEPVKAPTEAISVEGESAPEAEPVSRAVRVSVRVHRAGRVHRLAVRRAADAAE